MMPIEKMEVDFRKQVLVATQLIRLINDRNDQLKALFWLKKLVALNVDIPSVKRARNEFLDYFLNVLRDAVYAAALSTSRGMHLSPRARLKLKEELRHIGDSCHRTYVVDEVLRNRGPQYMCRWSPDKRTYVAMQPLPGRGALVYMAVTGHPELGWTIANHKPPDAIDINLSNPS